MVQELFDGDDHTFQRQLTDGASVLFAREYAANAAPDFKAVMRDKRMLSFWKVVTTFQMTTFCLVL